MRKHWKSVVIMITALTALAVAGCTPANQRDLEGVNGKHPNKIELYVNVDQHPNLVRLCIDHVAFVTTSRENGQNFLRVPEWDVPWCGATPTATSIPK